MLLKRVVPKGGEDIYGRFFGEGTILGIDPWVAIVQRDKGVFGDDAEKWRPKRWEEAKKEGEKEDGQSFSCSLFSLGIS